MLLDKNTIKHRLFQAIDDSLALLNKASIKEQEPAGLKVSMPSLLDQCIKLCEHHHSQIQEPIRLIHHFGLPSDSLLLPSLATLPNTQVLKDIYQNYHKAQDRMKSGILVAKEIPSHHHDRQNEADYKRQNQLFLSYLQQVQQDNNLTGQRLLICDNYFSSWIKGRNTTDFLALTKNHFTLKRLIIAIDPADSYAIYRHSIVENTSLSFEQYCHCILDFIQANPELKIIRHEDFIDAPENTMAVMCDNLGLPNNQDFALLRSVFDVECKTSKIDDVISSSYPSIYYDLCQLMGYARS
jgi:hypothetical protein